jgi:D-alanyl-D-alanine carboxypeptidase
MNDHASLISPTLSFTNPAGLDNGVIAGGSGSAYDVARMMILARKIMPSILDATTHARTTVTTEQGQLHGVPNTNQSIVEVLRAEASKTGYTDNAGGNLALVTDISIGHPVVIVVLGSTRLERFTDVLKLYKALLTSIE